MLTTRLSASCSRNTLSRARDGATEEDRSRDLIERHLVSAGASGSWQRIHRNTTAAVGPIQEPFGFLDTGFRSPEGVGTTILARTILHAEEHASRGRRHLCQQYDAYGDG